MPVYRVQDPQTGAVVKIEGDSPPTEAELTEIFATLETQVGAAQTAVQPPSAVDPDLAGLAPQAQAAVMQQRAALAQQAERQAAQEQERQAALSAMPQAQREYLESLNPLEAGLIGAGRGLRTLGRGVGLLPEADEFEQQAYQQLAQQQPIATTTGEIAAEAAPFLLPGLGVAGAGARLATVAPKLGRAAQVLGTGGLGAGEAAIITRGQGGDVGDQLFAAGIGGSAAGALELGLPVIGRIGGKIIRRVLGKAPEGSVVDAAGNPSQEFVQALAESGQSYDDVIRQAQNELREKAVDPREAARKAFLESQGLDPTKAQISRTADDFMAQQEAAKTSTAVRKALEDQEAVLTSRFNNKILETGGDATSQASSVTDFITDKATTLDQNISDLYQAARQAMPDRKNIRFTRLASKLRQLYKSDRRAGGNLSAIVGEMQAKGIFDKKGKLIGQVNVDSAEDLRKFMNQLYDEKNPFGNALLRQLKDELDDDVFEAAGQDYFQQARKAKADFESELNRAKISKFDQRKDNLVRDVLENRIDPDQLTDKVVFSKRWRPDDLEQLKNYLSTDKAGQAAFNDLRADVMEKIKEKAFIGPIDEAGYQTLSRNKLEKAISSIGAKKLGILFTAEERRFLINMLEVAKLREPVRGTAMGRGPSAQAISRVEELLSKIPLAGDWAVDKVQGRFVLKAKPTPVRTPRKPITIEQRAAIAPAAGVAGAALATQEQEQQ